MGGKQFPKPVHRKEPTSQPEVKSTLPNHVSPESHGDTSNSPYSRSDKLAIALACGSVVMLIWLFLAKTLLTVALLGIVAFGCAVYPIWHFVSRPGIRIAALVGVLAVTVVIGVDGLRHNRSTTSKADDKPATDAQTHATRFVGAYDSYSRPSTGSEDFGYSSTAVRLEKKQD